MLMHDNGCVPIYIACIGPNFSAAYYLDLNKNY